MADCNEKDHGCDSVAGKFQDEVFSLIGKSHSKVLDKIKDKLVNDQLDKNADLIIKGLAKRDGYHKQLADLKPDQEQFDDKGVLVTSTYSSFRADQRRKISKDLLAVNEALDKAISDADYTKLKEVLK